MTRSEELDRMDLAAKKADILKNLRGHGCIRIATRQAMGFWGDAINDLESEGVVTVTFHDDKYDQCSWYQVEPVLGVRLMSTAPKPMVTIFDMKALTPLLTLLFLITGACAVDDPTISDRGFSLPTYDNGLVTSPALTLENGSSLSDGLGVAHGVNTNSPLVTGGLFSTGTPAGVLDSAEGRVLASTIVGCALPPGQSVSKTVAGTVYVFPGKVGVAAGWKSGTCNATCRQWVSACVLAQTNASGATTPIEMRATNPAIGTTMKSINNTEQERAWFGDLFLNPPVAYQAAGANVADPDLFDRDCAGGSPCAIANVGTMAVSCTAAGSESASACTVTTDCTTTCCQTTGCTLSYLPITTHYAP